MRYLGLDYGSKTLGIAKSDQTGLIASSYGVLRYQNNIKEVFPSLLKIVEELQIDTFILGYPKNMNNTLGPRVELTLKLKEMLEEEFKLPVILMDERLSTVTAEKTLLLNNTTRKKRKKVIDAVAATIILQSYLDKRRNEDGK